MSAGGLNLTGPVKFELISYGHIRMRQTAVLGFSKSLSPTGLHCLRARIACSNRI
jgi:hypothetical protein